MLLPPRALVMLRSGSVLYLSCVALGCNGSLITLSSARVDRAAPTDEVVVYESIQHEARVGILFRGFETRLQARLESCRVRTSIVHAPLDEDGRASRATLTVVPFGGTYTRVLNWRNVEREIRVDGSFKLELFDHRAGRVTWRAVIDVKAEAVPGISDGETFADIVVARLRADGVVPCKE